MKSQDSKKPVAVAPPRTEAPRPFDRPLAVEPAAGDFDGWIERARRFGHSFATTTAAPPGAPVPVQARFAFQTADANRVLRPSTGGSPLPEDLKRRMEAGFEADFSDVRTHVGNEAPSIGALAYTRGSHIHFAPGTYSPASASGQKLLAHELTHVVQQRAGRVPVPAGPGLPINDDPALEREADQLGGRALSQAKRQPEE